MVITMAKLCMAHASTHGARKPPGPKISFLHISSSYATILIGGNKFSHTGDSSNWIKSKRRREKEEKRNTPGTAGGPGCRDRTLAVKS